MLAAALLVLFLVFPMVLRLLYVKAAILGLLLGAVAAPAAATGRLRLSRAVAGWSLVLAAGSMVFGVLGLLRGAPGAMKQMQVYAFWPLVYTLLLAGASRTMLERLHATMIWATLVLGLYGLNFALAMAGIVPRLPYLDWLAFGEEQGIGLHDGYVELLFPGLNSLPYLLPFLLGTLLVRRAEGVRPGRAVQWLALGATVALGLVSGRRAVFLVAALAPFVAFVLTLAGTLEDRRDARWRVLGIAGVLAAMLVVVEVVARNMFSFSLARVLTEFLAGFDFASGVEVGSYYRRQQYEVLLAQWLEHPWLGAGHGASATGLVRSAEVPWSYELYYVALLFQVGVVGVALYAAGIAWILWEGCRTMRRAPDTVPFLVPALTAFLCFLIASATNPYLARFDAIWMVFWPLAFVNSVRTRRWTEAK
jgi:O-antigen ligase